jgi:acetyl/propionyl-CoA carboxylase alpha subunit
MPDDIRVDSAVEEGGEVTPFYDPMIAKLIVHAPTREPPPTSWRPPAARSRSGR